MAENNEAAAVETTSDLGGGGGKSNKLVLIVSMVNMLVTFGIIGVLLLAFQKERSKPTVEDVVAGHAKGGGGGHGEAAGGHGEAKGGEHGGGHGGGEAKGGGAEISDTGKILTLDPFTINLASAAGTHPRFIRLNVSIELEPNTNEKEFEVKAPRVRDTIINLVNSKKPTDFNGSEGRTIIKDEIKRTVNAYLQQAKVKDVYITNFAISQ